MFEVVQGDRLSQIARILKDAGRGRPRSTRSPTPRTPTPTRRGIQVGYLRAEARRCRASDAGRRAGRPVQHRLRPRSPSPRASGSSHRGDPRRQDRLLGRGPREGRSTSPARSACPTTPTATPRATCSRRPTPSGRATTPVDMLRAMVRRWEQAAESAGLRTPRSGSATRPHELMTIASLVEDEGQRRGLRQDRPGHLQPPRDRAPDQLQLEIDATVNYASGPQPRRGDHARGPRRRLAVQHLPAPGPAAGADRARPATGRSRPR